MAASIETVARTLQAVAPTEPAEAPRPAPIARPRLISALLVTLVVTAGPLLLVSLARAVTHPGGFPLLFIAGALALGALRLDAYGSMVSLSPVAVVAAAALGGPAAGALAGCATALGAAPRSWGTPLAKTRITANIGSMTLAGAASGLPFLVFKVTQQPSWAWLTLLGGLAALALQFFNMVTVSACVAWSGGGSLYSVWRERFRWLVPQTTTLCLTGVGLAAAYKAIGAYEIAAFSMPVAAMYIAWQQYLAHTRQSVEDLRAKNGELAGLTRELQAAYAKLTTTYKGTLEALIGALDARDNETEGHSYRVSAYSQIVAERLGIARGSVEWETIARGALLHDVGKVGVRDAVLLKPGGLNDDEWVEMRSHAGTGYGILAQVEFLQPAAQLVWAHHEKYDGSGYPRGLKGEEIPLGARIFSVADAFDAMTSDRPYRKAMAPEIALAELQRCAGSQFDPIVVDAFMQVWRQVWSAREHARQMVA